MPLATNKAESRPINIQTLLTLNDVRLEREQMFLHARQYHTRQVVLSGLLVRGESQEAVELEVEYKQRDHIYLTQELRVLSKKRVQVIGEVVRRLDSTLPSCHLGKFTSGDL